MVEEDIVPLLHKCKEPYRRPRLFNADWTDYKDEVWVSPESLGKNEGHKQSWRRDFPEIMRDGQMEAFLEKQKKTSSEERSKNVEFIKPLKLSLAAEHSDSTAIDSKRPATWSAIATKFPAIEQKSAYGISSTEGSELIAHGVSNEYLTKYPDNHLKSTTVETSQLYGCKIPAVIIGIVAFVSHEHIFKPETKEFSCSMLWDGCDAEDGRQDSANHHGSHHLMLLPEEGTEQKETTASSELPIASDELHASDSITDNNKLTFVSKGNAGECEKDLTGEPSSTRKSVSQTPCPLKLNPVCPSDETDSLPIELFLLDEDSLITGEDFRVMSYKDMHKRNQVKADRVIPGAPVDSSRKPMDTKAGATDEKFTHVTSVPPVYKGKMSYCASPALINSQVKAVNPKFKPQNPSNQAFSTNVFPQQMVTTTYMQEYHVQAFSWNYQMSGYECVPLPTPGAYGGTNLRGHRRALATKGTTVIFFLRRNEIYACVDSRETMELDGYHYIVSKLLRKFWIFWGRIFVFYSGYVPIG